MTKQLKNIGKEKDERSQYKTDSIIYKDIELKILLVEASLWEREYGSCTDLKYKQEKKYAQQKRRPNYDM